MMTKEQRFHHLQARWQDADQRWVDYCYQLKRQYGAVWHAPYGKQDREKKLGAAESRACERFIVHLENLSARSWRQGFPVGWLMRELSYADATTTGAMSTVAPPAYGYSTRDAEGFAGAIA